MILEAVEAVKKLGERLPNIPAPGLNGKHRATFESVAVIGAAGQTGELFTRTLSSVRGVEVEPVLRGGIDRALHREPELVILATPNPTKSALEEIAASVEEVKRPITLVLSQNGIDVVGTAEEVLADIRNQVTIVRASLFTNVSRGKDGEIAYNERKNRIALASVDEDQDNLQKVANTFQEAGFDVEVLSDYRSMEWVKLIANSWTSSTTITRLSPRETLRDRRLFQLELKGLKDRIAVLKAEGIPFADIKWVSQLKILASMPDFVSWFAPLRWYIADQTASARNNQPSAAAREIENGAERVEPTIFYHEPMFTLADKHNLEDPVDMAIHAILARHTSRRKEDSNFDLKKMSASERRELLFEVFNLERIELFVNKWSFLGIDFIRLPLEKYHELKTLSFEILGQENLQPVIESLRGGRSVLVTPNHRSHADHVTLIKAIQSSLPEDLARNIPIYIVAGMKFDKEGISGLFNHAYPHPVVSTLEPEDRDDKRWRSKIINKRSEKVIKKLLGGGPCILVVYLEGGRNKSEKLELQTPSEGSGRWLVDPHFDYDLPVVIKGTERMLAPGKQLASDADLSVEFCEVIPTADMKTQRVHSNIWDELFATRPMKVIASRLPVDQRGGY